MSNLRKMLVKAREKFVFYGENHRRKDEMLRHKASHAEDPRRENLLEDAAAAVEKARANDAMAHEIAEVLVMDAQFERMVATLQKPGEDILETLTPLQIMSIHMAGGAQSEAGELFDAIKRWAIYGKDLDLGNVIEELGDMEFFMEGLRQNLGISREATLAANREKLDGKNGRYKGTYSDEAAIARADKRTEQADIEAWEAPVVEAGEGPCPGWNCTLPAGHHGSCVTSLI